MSGECSGTLQQLRVSSVVDRVAPSASPSAMMCFRDSSPIIAAILSSRDDTEVLCTPFVAIMSLCVLQFVEFFLRSSYFFFTSATVLIIGETVFTVYVNCLHAVCVFPLEMPCVKVLIKKCIKPNLIWLNFTV